MNTPTNEHVATPRLLRKILSMPRNYKRTVLILADLTLIAFALWLVLSLRYQRLFLPDNPLQLTLFALGPVITVATFFRTGLYKMVTRFIGFQGMVQIGLSMGLAVLIWATIVFLSGQWGIPRSIVLPFAVLGALLIIGSRILGGVLLKSAGIRIALSRSFKDPTPVLIYGAGDMGVGLLQIIRRVPDRYVAAFVDPSPTMRGQFVGGVKVHAPKDLERLIARHSIKEILVALPHNERRELRATLNELKERDVRILILPDYEDVASGRIGVNELRAVAVGDLLGRDTVKPDPEILQRTIRGKSVLVTGAGGSIGSELSRQIMLQRPAKLVLLDVSELALYEIETELSDRQQASTTETPAPEIHAVLGSVLDEALISETISKYRIETIYHAAAYKHVPIVESNVIAGLQNNVFGLKLVAQCAERQGVERFILISTDKAVRPTNVMGASKRLAELILQTMATTNSRTVFSMVRFGNVLDSSGSVVQRFRKQIAVGGPVTVTHKDIVRYFMSIPEAAALVIQAGAMAQGGDVFHLDMGEPVKIDDLARIMIRLSGLEVRDESNPTGDIEIKYTGLRPGEKLYEELLIGEETSKTEHPQIFRSNEPFVSSERLERELSLLRTAIEVRDLHLVEAVLVRLVEDYAPQRVNLGSNDSRCSESGERCPPAAATAAKYEM